MVFINYIIANGLEMTEFINTNDKRLQTQFLTEINKCCKRSLYLLPLSIALEVPDIMPTGHIPTT